MSTSGKETERRRRFDEVVGVFHESGNDMLDGLSKAIQDGNAEEIAAEKAKGAI